MRVAYADPPYLGCGKLYAKHHPDALVWDNLDTHRQLCVRLRDEFPDGWAMSCSTASLEEMLHLCREVFGQNVVRVGAWVKPFASFKPNVTPAFAWEPVLFRGGRRRTRDQWSGRDWVSAMPPVFQRRGSSKAVPGQKPEAFAFWLFGDVFGMRDGDELVDLFPGSGAVAMALDSYRRQMRLA